MVKIDRTPLPQSVSITKDEDFRTSPVFPLLVKDFNNKCYLCEIPKESKWEVEHRQSKANFPARRHDWKNLFLSCSHCNGMKSKNYDDIIDCTITDPESFISFSTTNINTININAIGVVTPGIVKTVDLLNKVYNGIGRCITDFGCANLRNKVFQELSDFHRLLINYNNEQNIEVKQAYRRNIEAAIQRHSAFAAFKRLIIRNDVSLVSIFGALL
ncbi:HNH endonuclease [Treponema endosymbiont of Eucomonympha sp.]|uniref:HNH endonuclease n=1 Tax=Treponema endosymbiont of Eucomonympha sp. TaxID=1580831 RepID=UPI000AD81A9A|nr:HNH endonuclease [Treponema endosymbiont of Eucomonympha sp.]